MRRDFNVVGTRDVLPGRAKAYISGSHFMNVIPHRDAHIRIPVLSTLSNVSNILSYSLWLAWAGFLPASFGALLYLYCRHSVLDDRFHARDLLHLLPIVSCYLLNIDLVFAPDIVKQAYLQGIEPESVSVR